MFNILDKIITKVITKNTCIAIICGLFLFVGFKCIYYVKYIEFKVKIVSNQIELARIENRVEKNILNKKITRLEEKINGTASSFTDVLQKEQEKNNSLLNQFGEITNTVGALSKLSKTDPELLKKYSKVYFLNEHYVPISLTNVGPTYISAKSKNYQIHSDVVSHLEDMIKAGNADGMSILVLSAYRSFQTQSILKSNYKVIYGAGTANSFSADQGYSEHQLGTAVDFTTLKLNGALEGFDKTPEYKWLGENAYKYGFVISYPAGNTYYKFEPWHWRFVGVALATKLHDDGINFYNMDQRLIDNYLANIFD